ncbi:uncharacterized protein BXZ73DRAFT_76867 [Epithele typhae]|uniref:uncharacterized protein n=1 Tax=Epithele typhae TaxID=378194 RepID=UPI0020075687|nr:uncharacterized protein BXZ73DRAFT_76867 [Epithele typhae]KAH9935167.1 hypothetical protein BXZ73DRAFT_76867 [Epithele typhae]
MVFLGIGLLNDFESGGSLTFNIHAEAITTTVESSVIIPVTSTGSTPISTLFSPCPSTGGGNSTTSVSTSTTTSGVSTSVSTIIGSSATTLPNGQVSYFTFTSTETKILSPTIGANSNSNNDSSTVPLGPVIGGALGGFVGLIVLAVLFWYCWRRKDGIRQLWNKEHMPNFEPSTHASWIHRSEMNYPAPGPEPKPYMYGLVGGKTSTPSRSSSPNGSPVPTRPQSIAHPTNLGLPAGQLTPGSYAPGYGGSNHGHTTTPGHSPSPYATAFPPQGSQPPTPGMHNVPGPGPMGFAQAQIQPLPSAYITPLPPSPLPAPAPAPAQPQPQPQPQPTLAAPAPPAPAKTSARREVTSVGTAVSYPTPVPLRSEDLREAESDDEGDGSSVPYRPPRLSLRLANWNPDTDGELFPRASGEDDRRGVVRQRRGTQDDKT